MPRAPTSLVVVIALAASCGPSQECRDYVACQRQVDPAVDVRAYDEGGSCWVKTDADCRRSEACKRWGACTKGATGCIIGDDENCKRLPACKELGRCSVLVEFNEGKCVAKTDADCRESTVCRRFGWCSAAEGRCQPS